MREVIIVQVGQCGNQCGGEFWRTLLREHQPGVTRQNNSNNNGAQPQQLYTDSLSTFFENIDTSLTTHNSLPLFTDVHTLKARGVLIDMEEGALKGLLSSEIGPIFSERMLMSGTKGTGSGNNFADGFCGHPTKDYDSALDLVSSALERCDSPQGLMFLSSMGGGTGSGFGSKLLEMCKDNFGSGTSSALSILSSPVLPGRNVDDVVIGPYNAILSMATHSQHADVIMPFDNETIFDNITRIKSSQQYKQYTTLTSRFGVDATKNAFADVNSVIARALSSLTASMRFGGELNLDLNELSTNMVPFSRLNFVCSSLSPYPLGLQQTSMTATAGSLFGPDSQLVAATRSAIGTTQKDKISSRAVSSTNAVNIPGSPKNNTNLDKWSESLSLLDDPYFTTSLSKKSLASTLLVRGKNITAGAINDSLYSVLGLYKTSSSSQKGNNTGSRQTALLKHPLWASSGFKTGICSTGPARNIEFDTNPSTTKITNISEKQMLNRTNHTFDMLLLKNSPQILLSMESIYRKFYKMYSRKVYLHHYTKLLEEATIDEMQNHITKIIEDYNDVAIKFDRECDDGIDVWADSAKYNTGDIYSARHSNLNSKECDFYL